MNNFAIGVLCLTLSLWSSMLSAKTALTMSGYKTIRVGNAEAIVEQGFMEVPENRKNSVSNTITLPLYRLKSTAKHPASAIFLLAGGPGASWIDQFEQEENFREVLFYQSIADVVLFDQRGAGHSLPRMQCSQTLTLDHLQLLQAKTVRDSFRKIAGQCRDVWLTKGIDLSAYNTMENAADVNDLRNALGYSKISLIGGSYGSHLALHYMKRYPETLASVLLHGVEGPDHTWDNPAGLSAALQRIALVAEQSTQLHSQIPPAGLLATLQQVIDRLQKNPQKISISDSNGKSTEVIVDAELVRQIASRNAGRRNKPNAWPEMILAMHHGDYSEAARIAARRQTLQLSDPMHYMMDCSSGISASRRKQYADDPATRLLGDINVEYDYLCDAWPSVDLGDDFRSNATVDTPTLILHGTWDTSTPIENAREVAAALPSSHLVEVRGGTHGVLYNLYSHDPPAREWIRAFLAGEKTAFPSTVDLPAVEFSALPKK
ncbi:MAG: alpha/beta fold hydrolase [Arenimonas sp.]